ncbi:MAG: hypothetical protein B7Z44_00400 [Caulobacter sp. 12-67-6]|nr:MAG: hypothetical protein B7Z44_00400 [Caulobacter sp. 12-67-6]
MSRTLSPAVQFAGVLHHSAAPADVDEIACRGWPTLKGLTPYEFIGKMWTNEPQRFRLNPTHQTPGLNT